MYKNLHLVGFELKFVRLKVLIAAGHTNKKLRFKFSKHRAMKKCAEEKRECATIFCTAHFRIAETILTIFISKLVL